MAQIDQKHFLECKKKFVRTYQMYRKFQSTPLFVHSFILPRKTIIINFLNNSYVDFILTTKNCRPTIIILGCSVFLSFVANLLFFICMAKIVLTKTKNKIHLIKEIGCKFFLINGEKFIFQTKSEIHKI